MYKILLLTDFSDPARHAITFAQTLFNDTAAEFCLFYACPIEPEMEFAGATLLAERWQTAEKELKKLQTEMARQPEPPYHTFRAMAKMGAAVGLVNHLLTQEYFDLIVLGATGLGWSEVLGSLATNLVREAKTNVLVVPASAPIRLLKHIVLATDYRSVGNAESFAILCDLASRKAAQVTLLTIENPKQPTTHAPTESRAYVLEALKNIQTEEYVIRDDSVVHAINDYLGPHTVDLLVMLPHHKGLFDALLHRSVSRSVIYHPVVPILTLYDDAGPPVSHRKSADSDLLPFDSPF